MVVGWPGGGDNVTSHRESGFWVQGSGAALQVAIAMYTLESDVGPKVNLKAYKRSTEFFYTSIFYTSTIIYIKNMLLA
jgi:hypothetical protein